MGAGYAAILLGALIPTFLLSRLLLWATRRWNGGVLRLLLLHLISGVLACIASAYGDADAGAPDWSAIAPYVGAQLIWFVVDIVRGWRQQSQPAG